MRSDERRDLLKLAGLTVAGVVCLLGLQLRAPELLGTAPADVYHMASLGRMLGTSEEYNGARQSLAEIWNDDGQGSVGVNGTSSGGGISGSAGLITSTVLVLVLGSLAAGAGIGGGGLFVPIYMTLLGAGPKGAVPLSKATILGGAVGNFLSNGRGKHPKAKRPLIDYESSTFMQSGELLGVVFGALLNNLLPAFFIVMFLVAILSFNSFKTIKKGIAVRKKETAAFAKAAAAKAAKAEPNVSATPSTDATSNGVDSASAKSDDTADAVPTQAEEVAVEVKGEDGKTVNGSAAKAEEKAEEPAAAAGKADGVVSAELQAILDADAKQFPVVWWVLLTIMTSYIILYSLIRKVIADDPGCMDWAYWLWYVTPVPILGGFMWYTAVLLKRKHERKLAAGFKYLEADMQWDSATLKKFPSTALLAGVTAGLLGIGGGMVIGPLFLSIGMEPQVGTSSCAFMILWTAFSGVLIYGVDGNLGWELAVWCVGFGFISGQIGQLLVNAVLKKTGRPSYVVFLLGSIIGLATVAMATTLIVKMAQGDYDANDVIEFDERPDTHLVYLKSEFGCPSKSSVNGSGSS